MEKMTHYLRNIIQYILLNSMQVTLWVRSPAYSAIRSEVLPVAIVCLVVKYTGIRALCTCRYVYLCSEAIANYSYRVHCLYPLHIVPSLANKHDVRRRGAAGVSTTIIDSRW